jgi:RNA polymerase sigma-70 factor (sigma-E family)
MRMRGTRIGREADRLGAVYEAHRLALLRVAVLLTGREDMAEDLVQDAFERAADKLAKLEAPAIRPYLRVVILNLWKNRLRRFSLENRFRLQPLPGVDLAFEERDALWSAIRRLPARRRACLVLRYFEDLSERETAELLNCSIGTVKSQTSKALGRLRQELNDADRG